ncbi:MAG TPA: PilT/PilU family type 4a pilus ATPase, partial [Gammaproteobacteria bacterium]
PPLLRRNGELWPMKSGPLDDGELHALLLELLNEAQQLAFEAGEDLDFAYELGGHGAFRVNLFRKVGGIAATFRVIPEEIPSLDELGIPHAVRRLLDSPHGLILVTGTTGCGKTTSLASMIDHLNGSRKLNIISLEDPIEYIHPSRQSLVIQREVGTHVPSFSAGLREALREDPDVILVGELRDTETIELALIAAETGHLVLSTLHTRGAVKTVDRVIDALPLEQRPQGANVLAHELLAVLSQCLVLNAERSARRAVFETMLVTPAIGNLIAGSKIHQIRSSIETGREAGMQTLDQALMQALEAGEIDPDDAYLYAHDKRAFQRLVKDPSLLPQVSLVGR